MRVVLGGSMLATFRNCRISELNRPSKSERGVWNTVDGYLRASHAEVEAAGVPYLTQRQQSEKHDKSARGVILRSC